MKPRPTLENTLRKCEEFGFNERITHETLWNTAYQLGRSRWYWGPRWMPPLIGRFNTWANTWSKSQLCFLIVIVAFLSALALWAAWR